MNSFILKIIALICMCFDHVGNSILGKFSFLNLIGRFSFPIFAFQSVQGYIHTKNFKKHMIKLLIFACISQIPFQLFLSTYSNSFYLNIFFTFLLGLFSLHLYDHINNKFIGLICVTFIAIIGELIKVDYGAFGIILMFIFYVFKDKKKYLIPSTLLLFLLHHIPNMIEYPSYILTYTSLFIFSSLSLIFICFYNKKEGPKAKYLFYIFYPLHLLILYILSTFFIP